MRQLPLGIVLPDSTNFDTFFPGPNEEVVTTLRQHIEHQDNGLFFVHGSADSGKTHLLQAACHRAADMQLSPVYLSFATTEALRPDALNGLEHLDLIAIDDLHRIAGLEQWEHALFHLMNAAREHSTMMIVAASNTPEALGIRLPDLRSRIDAGLIYRVRSLDDHARLRALQLRAQNRGMELSDEVGAYLLSRYPRNLGSLFEILNKLDEVSLIEQRRITIPFIRQALNQPH